MTSGMGFMVLTWTATSGGGEWRADWDGLVHPTHEVGLEAFMEAVESGERARLVELVATGEVPA